MEKKSTKPEAKPYDSFLDIRKLIPWITVLFFLTFLVLAFLTYRSFLLSLFISGVFYIIFLKPYYFFYEKLGRKKTLASIITTTLMILTIAIPLTLIIINLIHELSYVIEFIRIYIKDFNPSEYKKNEMVLHIIRYLGLTEADIRDLQIKIFTSAQEYGFNALKDLHFIVNNVSRFFFNFIISIFVLFYFFRNGDIIGKTIYDNFPFPEELKSQVVGKMVSVFNAVVKGNIFIALAQGAVIGMLFWVFGLSTPILYGILGIFFGFIPILGTNILWIPASLYLYNHDGLAPALVFGIIAFAAYLLLENLAKPMLLDKELNLHPLVLLLAILGGLTEFGIKGLLIGPFSVTIFLTLWQLVKVWNINHGIIEK